MEIEWERLIRTPECTAEQVLALIPAIEEAAKRSTDDRLETMLWSGIEELREAWGAKAVIPVASAILLRLPKSATLRDQAAALYREAHGSLPGFDALLEESGLAGAKPPRRALRTLEVALALNEGSFLVAREDDHAVRVAAINRDRWTVVMEGPKGRETLSATDLADRYFSASADDFRVVHDLFPEKFAALLRDDPAGIILSMLKSQAKPISADTLENLLSPRFVKTTEWKSWWAKAKTSLKKSPNVRMEGRSPILLTFDPHGTTPEREAEAEFQKAKGLAERWIVFEDYVRQAKSQKSGMDRAMLIRFAAEFQRMAHHLTEQRARTAFEAWLMCREVEKAAASTTLNDRAAELLRSAPDVAQWFDALETLSLWSPACEALERARPHDAVQVLSQMLPTAPFPVCNALAEHLESLGLKEHDFAGLTQTILTDPYRCSEALFWLWDGPSVRAAAFDDRKGLLLRILRLLADVQRRDDLNAELLKRIRARARSVLAARGFEQIQLTLLHVDPAVGATLKTQVRQLTGLGQAVQEDLLKILTDRFPDAPKGPAQPLWRREDILLCTDSGRAKREAELNELVNVKMRQNAIAIGEAASHGDLSENSEYKFALEERDLLRARVAQIQSEMSMARLIDSGDLSSGLIVPGCRTRLRRVADDQTLELVILGPWEANVEKGVYNYKSPIGQALLGLRVGQQADLNVGMLVGTFEIQLIEPAIG